MKTISQVAKLTGVSIRTLQYYDKIGLLKPNELTPSGSLLFQTFSALPAQRIVLNKERTTLRQSPFLSIF